MERPTVNKITEISLIDYPSSNQPSTSWATREPKKTNKKLILPSTITVAEEEQQGKHFDLNLLKKPNLQEMADLPFYIPLKIWHPAIRRPYYICNLFPDFNTPYAFFWYNFVTSPQPNVKNIKHRFSHLLQQKYVNGELTRDDIEVLHQIGAIKIHMDMQAYLEWIKSDSQLQVKVLSKIIPESNVSLTQKISGNVHNFGSSIGSILSIMQSAYTRMNSDKKIVTVPSEKINKQVLFSNVLCVTTFGCSNCGTEQHSTRVCSEFLRFDTCFICGRNNTTTEECMSLNSHDTEISESKNNCICGISLQFFRSSCSMCFARSKDPQYYWLDLKSDYHFESSTS